jgi:hypothetical protein
MRRRNRAEACGGITQPRLAIVDVRLVRRIGRTASCITMSAQAPAETFDAAQAGGTRQTNRGLAGHQRPIRRRTGRFPTAIACLAVLPEVATRTGEISDCRACCPRGALCHSPIADAEFLAATAVAFSTQRKVWIADDIAKLASTFTAPDFSDAGDRLAVRARNARPVMDLTWVDVTGLTHGTHRGALSETNPLLPRGTGLSRVAAGISRARTPDNEGKQSKDDDCHFAQGTLASTTSKGSEQDACHNAAPACGLDADEL